MTKFLFSLFLLLASFDVLPQSVSDDDNTECENLAILYAVVFIDLQHKVSPDEISKKLLKTTSLNELQIAQIIFHTTRLLSLGWTQDRIYGFIDGRCIGYRLGQKEKSILM